MNKIVTIKFNEYEINYILESLFRFRDSCEVEMLDDIDKLIKKVKREVLK